MPPTPEPLSLAGTRLAEHRHVCAFFSDPDEEYRVLLPFIKQGFDQGDKAYHVVDPTLRESHLRHLASAGVDVASAWESGQLELSDWEEVYWLDGPFDQDKMLELLRATFIRARRRGFRMTRLVSNKEWALAGRSGGEQLVEYEARFNTVLEPSSDTVICCYDLTRFPAETAIDVMRAHPMVIVGGILQQNPFFVPPGDLLRELGLRESRRRPART